MVYAKLEEENGGLGDRRIFITKRADRSPRDEEARRGNDLIRNREGGVIGVYAIQDKVGDGGY